MRRDIFARPLTEKFVTGTPRGEEILVRTPMKRFGELEELGGAAIFLASDAASFVTGTLLVVDGGFLASGVNLVAFSVKASRRGRYAGRSFPPPIVLPAQALSRFV